MLTGLARQWPALSTALRWPKGTGLGLRQEYSSEAQARMLSLLQLSRPDELQVSTAAPPTSSQCQQTGNKHAKPRPVSEGQESSPPQRCI